jgi:type I restriction enzyme S subunit
MPGRKKYEVSQLLASNSLTIGDGYRAKNSELSSAGLPFARAGNIKNGFDFKNADYLAEKDISKVGEKVSRAGDIVFTSKGTVGRFAYVKETTPRFVYSPQLCYWRTHDTKLIHPRFLFYWMQAREFYCQMDAVKGQTDMADYVSLADQRRMIITLPELNEQHAIAEVLSSVDDKIDLLRRQNRTLEALTETLFLQLEGGASKSWREVPLRSVCEIVNGFAFKSGDYKNSGRVIIRTLNFKDGYVNISDAVYISFSEEAKYSKYHLRRNDFLLVMVGASLGNFAVVTSEILPALQNQNMWSFRSLGQVSQHYLNFALRKLIRDNLGAASGSAREFFQKSQFYQLPILIPPDGEVNRFHDFAALMFSKIELNRKQILTLTRLRDSLLPKLMSGEVSIKNK